MSNPGEVAERLRRSTVRIHSQGNGSGVIWSSDGTIVTNAHVVRGAGASVELWDGARHEARVVARHPRRDLAIIRSGASGLPAAAIGDANALRPGNLVLAVGNPLGFAGAVSTGTVHGLGPVRGLGNQIWLRANVRLAPGNSGGPLANASGQVVGINTAVAAGGIGLAVPTEAVRRFIKMGPESVSLGVSIHATPMRLDQRDAVGLVVLEVTPGSAADRASLMPGDVLIGTAERWFSTSDDLGVLLDSGMPSLRLRFLRGERRRWREVVVQLRPTTQQVAA